MVSRSARPLRSCDKTLHETERKKGATRAVVPFFMLIFVECKSTEWRNYNLKTQYNETNPYAYLRRCNGRNARIGSTS